MLAKTPKAPLGTCQPALSFTTIASELAPTVLGLLITKIEAKKKRSPLPAAPLCVRPALRTLALYRPQQMRRWCFAADFATQQRLDGR